MDKLLTKVGVSFGTSLVVCESVNLQPLWSALVTFGVSLLTVLSIEGISWLRSWFRKKEHENEEDMNEEKKDK